MKTIAMLNMAETTRDPRVRRVAGSLAARGARVVVLGPTWEQAAGHSELDGFSLRRVEGPRRALAPDMAALGRASALVAEIVERIHRPILEQEYGRRSNLAFLAYRRAVRSSVQVGALEVRGTRPLERPAAVTQALLRKVEPIFADRPVVHGIRSMLLTNLRLFEEARKLRPDVVHVNDLNALIGGVMLKESLKIPLVYDAHEIYAEQFSPQDRPELWYRFYSALERALLPYTDARMTVCDGLGEFFASRYGAEPFVTIRNVPALSLLAPERVLDRRNKPRVVMYHGNYFKYRGLDELIRAAVQLPELRFVLRGFGAHEAALRRLADEVGASGRVEFAAPVSVHELIGAASEADVGVCPFVATSENMRLALPNKLFEYLAAGLAVAVSDLPELRRVVDGYQVGVKLSGLDPSTLASSLRELVSDEDRLDEYRRRAWRAARDELNWEHEVNRLFGLYGGWI